MSENSPLNQPVTTPEPIASWNLDQINIIPPEPQTAEELRARAKNGELLSIEESLYLRDGLYRYGEVPPPRRAAFHEQVAAAEKRAGITINAPYDAS